MGKILMNLAFIVALIVIVIASLIIFKKNKKMKITTSLVIVYVLTIISVIVVTYLWAINYPSIKIISKLQNIQPILSPTITTFGLITTVGISLVTINFNQKKQEMDLIYSLIKDQKNLINEKFKNDDSESLKELTLGDIANDIRTRCQKELSPSNIAYIRLVQFLIENKEKIFRQNNIKDSSTLSFYKRITRKRENISDRDIEIIVLISWHKYIEKNLGSQFKSNKLPDTQTSKLGKLSLSRQKEYMKLGAYLFQNALDFPGLDDQDTRLTYNYLKSETKYEEAAEIINNIYRINYYKLGHLFKHFHRIIRLILEGSVSKDQKVQKELLGILRAQFPEDILILLYYNATYTYRGYGLGCLLQGTKFFGDRFDFDFNQSTEERTERTHISSSKFYFSELDTKIIQDVYGSGKFVEIPKNKTNEQELFVQKIKNLQNNIK